MELKHHEREKGTYTKRKLEYWNDNIQKLRQEKRAKYAETNLPDDTTQQSETTSPDSQELHKMKISELRKPIRERGIKVKGMSKLKKDGLVSLLKQHGPN